MILGFLFNWCTKGRECLLSQLWINPLKVFCLRVKPRIWPVLVRDLPWSGLRILGLLRAVELVRRSKSTVLGRTAITLRSVVVGMNLGWNSRLKRNSHELRTPEMNQCWFPLGGKLLEKRLCQGKLGLRSVGNWMNCFLENLTLGTLKFLKVRGMGRIWIVQGPPGKMFYMGMIFMLTFTWLRASAQETKEPPFWLTPRSIWVSWLRTTLCTEFS